LWQNPKKMAQFGIMVLHVPMNARQVAVLLAQQGKGESYKNKR
jgi:hypothetical protein